MTRLSILSPIVMFSQYISYLFIFILIQSTLTCPIPFDIQSKCRCAITETGRVYIYCARKQLLDIPRFNNSNIIFDELVLSGNRITVVHKNAFNGLKLRKLELQSNPINRIDQQAFIDLANYLEEFILSTTLRTSQLTSQTFFHILAELPNLKRLSLRSFDLSDLTNYNQSLVMRKLTQLALQSCSISQMDEIESFRNLFPNLERLDLSENRLEYLNIPFLTAFRKLKVLILSKNKIRHLNLRLLNPNPTNSLIELDLSYNGIETIDENVIESLSSQLEILNLRNNELTNEKQLTFLVHLSQLREFYLDYNRLESIHQMQLPLNLKLVSLKNNRLNQLDLTIFTRLEQLEKLFLSSNKLTKLSSKNRNTFPVLELLELDRNQLTNLMPVNAPKLKQLNLDGNFLGANLEKKIFRNLPSLERLHLRDNQIEFIDSNTFQHTNLQFLDLRNNSLKSFPLLTKLNETLQILSLRRNQICTIDTSALNFYRNLLTLELDQNPLHCDCRMERNFRQLKISGQCESPPERRNVNLNELPNEPFACSLITTPQCTYLTKTIMNDDERKPLITTTTTTMTSTTITTETTSVMKIVENFANNLDRREEFYSSMSTTTTIMDQFSLEQIRIADLIITPNFDNSKLLLQWQISPSAIDLNPSIDHRRRYFKHHGINGFKISTNSPMYKMSELLDSLQRNYTIDYVSQGEVCLYLLRKTNYEKFCKQLQMTSTQTLKSSLIIDPKQRDEQQNLWYMNEPTKSILIGSIFGILLVLSLLTCIILIISRCPYVLFCRLRSSKYHQSNDSKSESLLVRPTPTNTIPWSNQSQQHYYPAPPPPPLSYHPPPHQLRPISYQASLSTQCTCPTHYHSSGTSSTDSGSASIHGQNYHIYQEILNDDFNLQNHHHHRLCRSSKTDKNSSSINSEQCQLCSLSVLV
ncbi:unnamed protein product [Adineta ricciae]|uniref:Uncharacterized protein n=1 Tax=Adineta ricciae TaxID=249248 RepID=A0A815M2N2_ADIRI|nr:unnamed protein product [Adineta ricciae]